MGTVARAACMLHEESVNARPCPEPLPRDVLSMNPGLMMLGPPMTPGSNTRNVEIRSNFVPDPYSKSTLRDQVAGYEAAVG